MNEEKLEQSLAALLRTGVLLAAAVVLAGGTLYLARHGSAEPAYASFHGEPADLRTIRGIWHAALSSSSRGIIQLGLLILIATPVARVAVSAVGFARKRDWPYVACTLVVLSLLLFSLFGR